MAFRKKNWNNVALKYRTTEEEINFADQLIVKRCNRSCDTWRAGSVGGGGGGGGGGYGVRVIRPYHKHTHSHTDTQVYDDDMQAAQTAIV